MTVLSRLKRKRATGKINSIKNPSLGSIVSLNKKKGTTIIRSSENNVIESQDVIKETSNPKALTDGDYRTVGSIRWAVNYWLISKDTFPINIYGSIENWNTSQVTDMYGLFSNTHYAPVARFLLCGSVPQLQSEITQPNYDPNSPGWYSGEMGGNRNYPIPRQDTTNFNDNITKWDTSNVIDMGYMFFGAVSFNQPIGIWNISNVKSMIFMFAIDLTGLGNDVSGTYSENADVVMNFNQPLNDWDTGNVLAMDLCFNNCIFNQDISSWNVSNCRNFRDMFVSNGSRPVGPFNKSLKNWKTNGGLRTDADFDNMFGDCIMTTTFADIPETPTFADWETYSW